MTPRTRDTDESAFLEAWTAFLEEEAKVTAPPRLEGRVMEAIRTEYVRKNGRRIGRRRLFVGLGIAAAVVLAVLSGLRRLPPAAERPSVAGRPSSPAHPAVLMTLAADPIRDSESLQLVRVRLSRADLTALGVAIFEPDASGLVDVDVIVGDDGLPRDIRRIRPVLAGGGRE